MLDRQDLVDLCNDLGDRLALQGKFVHLTIGGGAAMLFSGRRPPTTFTEDIDVLRVRGREHLYTHVWKMAAERKIRGNWLNEHLGEIAGYYQNPEKLELLFQHPNLVVEGAPARLSLALKIAATRDKDQQDIFIYMDELGIKEVDELTDLYAAIYPKRTLPKEKLFRLHQWVEEYNRKS